MLDPAECLVEGAWSVTLIDGTKLCELKFKCAVNFPGSSSKADAFNTFDNDDEEFTLCKDELDEDFESTPPVACFKDEEDGDLECLGTNLMFKDGFREGVPDWSCCCCCCCCCGVLTMDDAEDEDDIDEEFIDDATCEA